MTRRIAKWLRNLANRIEPREDFPPPPTLTDAVHSYADEVDAMRMQQEEELDAAANRAIAAHKISNVEPVTLQKRKRKLASVPKE